MLWLILGDFGSGKTLFMVLVAQSSQKNILGNFNLNLENYQKIDPIELKLLGHNKLVLLDEIYLWLESRISGSFLNRYLTHIVLQSRHRDIDILGSAQVYSSVDLRFRTMAHRLVRCERVIKSSVLRDERDFRYTVFNTYSLKSNSFILRYDKAKEYFPLYDTYEELESIDQIFLEREIESFNPKKRYESIERLAIEISESLDTITHDSLKLELLRRGLPSEDHNLIYAHLKKLKII